jgi:pimeloyl-ACP methyl ester carboxylesterase
VHALEWGSAAGPKLPVLCLPGHARTADDFGILGAALAVDGRRVVALDSRGRGGSDRDPDPGRYTVPVEAADALAVCDRLGIGRAVLVGTSRGGLLAMALAAMRPSLLAGVVLNDIGPVIEPAGLARIRSYVGRMPTPASWEEAGRILAGTLGRQFPTLSPGDWERRARLTWTEEGGGLALRYDPRLGDQLGPAEIPPLWEAFDRFGATPLLVIRGGLSDLLSAATVDAMRARLPRVQAWTVDKEGHAPLLEDAATMARIAGFVAGVE